MNGQQVIPELNAKFEAAIAVRDAYDKARENEREAGANARKIAAEMKRLTAQLEEAKATKKATKARADELGPVTDAAFEEYWRAYDAVHGTRYAESHTPEAKAQILQRLKEMHGEA